MDTDLIFVVGLVIGAFSLPAFVNAFSDRRLPKLAVLMLVVGAGMIVYAARQNPDAYTLDTVDDIFVSVVARFLN